MIIDDLNIKCVRITPDKTDPPFIIDADAVLAPPVGRKGLQAVSRWRRKIAKFRRAVQLAQFPAGDAFEGGKAWYALAVKERAGVAAAEGPDHLQIV
jgi:hypothetical protein